MSTERSNKYIYIFAHLSLFIIFFWFGALKFFDLSPASELVDALRAIMLPWWPMESFIIFLGIWEVTIGILLLFKKTERLGIMLLIPHMITTFFPLYFLQSMTWQSAFAPTLEGQYIIKNLIVVSLASSVVLFKRS